MPSKKTYTRLKNEKLCTNCAKRPISKHLKSRCEECNNSRTKKRERRKIAGRCVSCGKCKDINFSSKCSFCKANELVRNAFRREARKVKFERTFAQKKELVNYVQKALKRGICEVTKKKFGAKSKGKFDNSPSLDRIDNDNILYLIDNIQVVTYRFNSLKGSHSIKAKKDRLELAEYLDHVSLCLKKYN